MYLGGIVFTIYLQLKQISGNPSPIQFDQKAVATWFLWMIQSELSNKPQQFRGKSHPTQNEILELWDLIHIACPALAVTYLDVLLNCINTNHNQVIECVGSGQVARAASLCLLRVLSAVNPASRVVEDMRLNYVRVIPHNANFKGLQCYYAINVIHTLFVSRWWGQSFGWMDYKPHLWEHALFANTLVQVASKAREHQGKVPRWILRFVLHSLSLDPLPSTLVTDCLSIIAMDLGCNVSSTRPTILEERYVYA